MYEYTAILHTIKIATTESGHSTWQDIEILLQNPKFQTIYCKNWCDFHANLNTNFYS